MSQFCYKSNVIVNRLFRVVIAASLLEYTFILNKNQTPNLIIDFIQKYMSSICLFTLILYFNTAWITA